MADIISEALSGPPQPGEPHAARGAEAAAGGRAAVREPEAAAVSGAHAERELEAG